MRSYTAVANSGVDSRAVIASLSTAIVGLRLVGREMPIWHTGMQEWPRAPTLRDVLRGGRRGQPDAGERAVAPQPTGDLASAASARDRKSTRLNSSHSQISYA